MTITLKEKTQLIVPPRVQRLAGIKAGDRLEFKASQGVVMIVAKPTAPTDDYTAAQRSVIDRAIAEGLNDIAKGRVYGPFHTAEDMAASIEGNIRKLRRAKKLKRAR